MTITTPAPYDVEPTSAPEWADLAPTPAALLDRVRQERAVADRAEVAILELAVEWARAHPADPARPADESWRVTVDDDLHQLRTFDTVEELDGYGIPPVAWDAPATFAAANGMSTAGGRAVIRDALVLRHRLPRTWAQVTSGRLQAWRARRIARSVLGAPADVVAHIDARLAGIAHKVGPVQLDRMLGEAMLTLHAEQGSPESLDVRRSMAVGILAHPEHAAALLDGEEPDRGRRRATTVLYVHTTADALRAADPVARVESLPGAVLADRVAAWCGRAATDLVVKAVVDLTTDDASAGGYEVPDLLRRRSRSVTAPASSRGAPSRPAAATATTSTRTPTAARSASPTSRRCAATTTGSRPTPGYRRLERGVFTWTDPHGHRYLRDPDGTTDAQPR